MDNIERRIKLIFFDKWEVVRSDPRPSSENKSSSLMPRWKHHLISGLVVVQRLAELSRDRKVIGSIPAISILFQ